MERTASEPLYPCTANLFFVENETTTFFTLAYVLHQIKHKLNPQAWKVLAAWADGKYKPNGLKTQERNALAARADYEHKPDGSIKRDWKYVAARADGKYNPNGSKKRDWQTVAARADGKYKENRSKIVSEYPYKIIVGLY